MKTPSRTSLRKSTTFRKGLFSRLFIAFFLFSGLAACDSGSNEPAETADFTITYSVSEIEEDSTFLSFPISVDREVFVESIVVSHQNLSRVITVDYDINNLKKDFQELIRKGGTSSSFDYIQGQWIFTVDYRLSEESEVLTAIIRVDVPELDDDDDNDTDESTPEDTNQSDNEENRGS